MTSVAVIGGGGAGIGAARRLVEAGADVTLFEAGPQLGGNCQPVDVRDERGRIWTVDAGVSDFNRTTFREFSRLVDDLGLPTRPIGTDTSFAAGSGRTVAACRAGRWTFDRSLAGHVADDFADEAERFRLRATEVLDDRRFDDWTVGRYLDAIGASWALRELYVVPRACGSFPMPAVAGSELPLRGLVEFWRIHGVVGSAPADRHCIVGGMHRYPVAFAEWFRAVGGELRCRARVQRIARHRRGVTVHVRDQHGRPRARRFDGVVCAADPGRTLGMLQDPSAAEAAALAAFPSQRARVVVHRDARAVGDRRQDFGAFHYVVPALGQPRVTPTITFFPNRLAGLDAAAPDVFVTMNPVREPRADRVVTDRTFTHPVAGAAQRAAATRVAAIQGARRTWYAGSFLSSPFVHESALTSGYAAAERALAALRSRAVRAAGARLAS